jgi:hypothetical protein
LLNYLKQILYIAAMGLFDNLRISPDLLPASAEEKKLLQKACEGGFQTKSLYCNLALIEITNEGRLRWQDTDWEEVPREKRPYPEAEEGSLPSLFGSMKRTNHRWVEEANYTGEIRFYDSIDRTRYEFCALFAEGILLRIVKTSP